MRRKYISILIVLLAIGFASVSTVLVIISRTSVRRNQEDFDVYFSKVYLNGVQHDEFISSNGKNIDFGIQELKNKGEEVTLTYEITNASSQYDADVRVLFDNLNTTSEYLEITKEDNYDGFIQAHSNGTGVITIRLLKPVEDDKDVDLKLNLGVDAEEKELDTVDHDYNPNQPKANNYSTSAIITDENEVKLINKVIVLKTANGLRYNRTDYDGYFYQDNIPEGTMTIYVFDQITKEEVLNMKESEIIASANRNIEITTSTVGRQVGSKMILNDISSRETNTTTIVEIKVDNKIFRKEVDSERKAVFNIDTNSSTVEIISYGVVNLTGENSTYNIPDATGTPIKVEIRNKKPTPPTLTGGSDVYILAENARVTIKTPGTATSGVSKYEYIVSENEITDFTNIPDVNVFEEDVKVTDEGTHYVYLRTVSNNDTRSIWSEVEVVKLDRSSPVIEIKKTVSTSNSIKIEFSATDIYSGIKSLKCYYGNNYETEGTIEGNTCHLNNLISNNIYKYKICAIDNVDNPEACKEGEAGTNEVKNPVITFEDTGNTGGYFFSQTAKVAFNNEGIATPKHYIKSTRKGIANVNVVGTCGTGDFPEQCTDGQTTTIEANVWYLVSGDINITYQESYDEYSELLAITFDGVNYSRKSTGTIGKIAFYARDFEYQNSLAPSVTTMQEAIDELYRRFN
ncbi:MAG: hypothetical protein OSJ65_04605 [Bacilli bacterium]|nr:hypothetical protein [Bacilli bacterium]